MKEFIDYDLLSRVTASHQNDFSDNKPFNHTVITDLIDSELLAEAINQLGDVKTLNPWTYNNIFEKKMAINDITKMPLLFRQLFRELNSSPFINWISNITNIKNLIPDPYLNGGGIHAIERGGKLAVHADYNVYRQLNLLRRVNLILYLNPNWKSEYGGQLELWNSDMTECIKKIEPEFNTMVLFESNDTSFHGHPYPLNCPEGILRKSLALYYYVNPNQDEIVEPHSTLYQRLPDEPFDPEIEELRLKRAKGRM